MISTFAQKGENNTKAPHLNYGGKIEDVINRAFTCLHYTVYEYNDWCNGDVVVGAEPEIISKQKKQMEITSIAEDLALL